VNRRILIVDDDKGIVGLMTLALERDGWEVTGATSLAEAKAAGAGWAVVIADVRLPNGDGRHLRALHPMTPMVVISGSGDEEPDLLKPFSMVQLRAAVEQVLKP
jgi:DNA-binding response OmpR family regulator